MDEMNSEETPCQGELSPSFFNSLFEMYFEVGPTMCALDVLDWALEVNLKERGII